MEENDDGVLGVLNTVENNPSIQGYKGGKHALTASAVVDICIPVALRAIPATVPGSMAAGVAEDIYRHLHLYMNTHTYIFSIV